MGIGRVQLTDGTTLHDARQNDVDGPGFVGVSVSKA
jgi:hypothetical protein